MRRQIILRLALSSRDVWELISHSFRQQTEAGKSHGVARGASQNWSVLFESSLRCVFFFNPILLFVTSIDSILLPLPPSIFFGSLFRVRFLSPIRLLLLLMQQLWVVDNRQPASIPGVQKVTSDDRHHRHTHHGIFQRLRPRWTRARASIVRFQCRFFVHSDAAAAIAAAFSTFLRIQRKKNLRRK